MVGGIIGKAIKDFCHVASRCIPKDNSYNASATKIAGPSTIKHWIRFYILLSERIDGPSGIILGNSVAPIDSGSSILR